MVLTQERNVIFDPSTGSANYKGGSCPQQHSCKLTLGLCRLFACAFLAPPTSTLDNMRQNMSHVFRKCIRPAPSIIERSKPH